jgi:hypothetical protein
MAPEQDWCLECGTAVTTRVVPPPGWRAPLVAALGVLLLLGVGVAIAVSSLSGDADRAAAGNGPRAAAGAPTAETTREAPPSTTTATTAAPPASATATTTTTTTTPTTPTTTVPGANEATGGGPVPVWPPRLQAYTVVVPTPGGRKEAEREARRLIAAGGQAGILKTDGFDFFSPGSWVVWTGRYRDRPAAEAKLPKVSQGASGAYVTLVRPRGGGGTTR